MTDSPLISTQDLADILGKPDVRIIDCRFNLQDPAWGRQSYLEGHIPGALYADLNLDLSSPITPTTGRHPLPDPSDFTRLLSRWGITPQTLVVAYDTVGGGFAGRLWLLLTAIGHSGNRLLDGGYAKWMSENRPTRSGGEVAIPAGWSYPPAFNSSLFASDEDVQHASQHPDQLLIDARAQERYAGALEPIDTIAGHIPNAKNRFNGLNLAPDGTFKPKELLRQEYLDLLQGHSPSDTIVYCGSGVTSCHHLIAMQLAGLPGARLYVGSWSQWIRDPAHPIAVGEQP